MDASGTPQMGATVLLLNKYHQAISKATSDTNGRFAFALLPPDTYSLSASLSSFLPAFREQLSVKPGTDSVLQIHLATLFSSVEVTYHLPSAIMSDDWKWVLRSASATRPVNRFLPSDLAPDSTTGPTIPAFSETHALFSLSGGDSGPLVSDNSLGQIGTGFALSTKLYEKNLLQVSGSLGEENSPGPPAIAVTAIYSYSGDSPGRTPEVTFSATQVAGIGSPLLQASQGGAVGTNSTGAVTLRTMSFGLYQTMDPLERLHLEYGVTGESVDYVQHSNRLSRFARATVDTGDAGVWIGSYVDGGRPDQLLRHRTLAQASDLETAAFDGDPDDFAHSMGLLQRLPQISNRNGRLAQQRTQTVELGYNKAIGSQVLAFSAFGEKVSDGRVNLAGDVSSTIASDVLSDTFSRSSALNIGNYRRVGFLSSINQRVTENVEFGLAYGRMGAFSALPSSLVSLDPSSPHPALSSREANFAAVNIKAVLRPTGTRIAADYGWVDTGAVMPRHVFTTQQEYAAPGLNIYFRQPVPGIFGMPGRVELTADMRNLLAQGYLPFSAADGRQLLIIQASRSVRGGLNFTF